MQTNQTFDIKNVKLEEAYSWPLMPKIVLFILMIIAILGLGWYGYLSNKSTELDAQRLYEQQLKQNYEDKYTQIQSLEALKEEKNLIAQQVKSLEGLLPSKTEMDKLLADINQSGIKRDLSFNLFKPENADLNDYYAKIPLNIELKGDYHKMALFLSDVAGLPRIVTSESLNLEEVDGKDSKDGQAKMVGTLNTYRLLDESEKKSLAEQKAQKKLNNPQ